MAWEPEVAFTPDHPPDAVQEPASVDDHVSVDDPPAAMPAGDAESDTVGSTGVATLTSALADAIPPAPVQVRM